MIEKVDANGVKKDVVVDCQLGQRSRIFKSWQNAERKAMIKLPMIIINRSGYSRDSSRVNNLHNEVKYEITSKNRLYDYLTPVPVSIQYEVTVLSKYQKDIDQIASNFMVFFNSSLYVSCIHPKYDGIKLNNQVLMDDSVSEDHPDEIDSATDDFITSTFNFTFKTFLFGGVTQAKKRKRQALSSVISTFVEHQVIELKPNEIDDFQKQHPEASMSALLDNEVTREVTTYVDDPNGDDVYEDFAPIINSIDVGFYPVPMLSSIPEHIKNVNSYDHEFYDISGYISSSGYQYKYDPDGKISAVVPDDMHYEKVNSHDTLCPYVDRLVWKIDASSVNSFPDNVHTYRKM